MIPFLRNSALVLLAIMLWSFMQDPQWKGQAPVRRVNTSSVPVQLQYKAVYRLGNGVYCSNAFDGARLSGVAFTGDTLVTVLITPENVPVNSSPWYAFKIWSESQREILVRLVYNDGTNHRYHPRVSRNGTDWQVMDSARVVPVTRVDENKRRRTVGATMHLDIGPDTLWIAGQELISTGQANAWNARLETLPFVEKDKAGESCEGRAIPVLKIGDSNDRLVNIILSRQHPPEITGYLAMQAFVETLCSDSKLAQAYRKKYNTYVFPVVNPDGVDHGHWRHNRGGIDLNRDWFDFNQPETRVVRDYVQNLVNATGAKVMSCIDFHSTWEDIYYINHDENQGNMPGLFRKMITRAGEEFPDYQPNIRSIAGGTGSMVTSDQYFFHTYGAAALTYEIGDKTSREFIRQKAEASAVKFMELMLE